MNPVKERQYAHLSQQMQRLSQQMQRASKQMEQLDAMAHEDLVNKLGSVQYSWLAGSKKCFVSKTEQE